MDNDSVPGNIYNFIPISHITGGGFDTDFLVDVMGLLTSVGTERECDRNGKRIKINVICVEADGYKIECTLFGPYVDELNTFLSSGEVQNAVVLIQFGKVKCFQDKIHLQNCMNYTKLFFNPDFDEAVKLRKRLTENMESPAQALSQLIDSTKVSMSEDFLELTPRKTILALKDVEKGSSYVVLATVIHILEDDDWWYTACICSKGVIVDSKMFFCGKCNKHVMKVEPRYCIKVRVMDETDSTTFVIFYRDATTLFNKSCAEMFELHDKSSIPGSLPKEISNLVGKTFLFKVEYNSKFLQSFGVKKICNDLSVINKFKDLSMKSVDVNSGSCDVGSRKETVIDGSSIDLAQDLMPKFSSAFVENESQCDDKEGFYISKDSEELTPLKRDCAIDLDQSDLELPLKMLKKNIKTEKD